DGNIGYTISFAISGGGAPYAGAAINPVAGTNQDNDTPNILVTALSGPTTEGGGTATFIVTFATAPNATTTITATSSNTAEAVVTSILPSNSFDAGNYNLNHIVTVTGVD